MRFPQNGLTCSPVRKICRSANSFNNSFDANNDIDGTYCTYRQPVPTHPHNSLAQVQRKGRARGEGVYLHNNPTIPIRMFNISTPNPSILPPFIKPPPLKHQRRPPSILPPCIHPRQNLRKRSAQFHDRQLLWIIVNPEL